MMEPIKSPFSIPYLQIRASSGEWVTIGLVTKLMVKTGAFERIERKCELTNGDIISILDNMRVVEGSDDELNVVIPDISGHLQFMDNKVAYLEAEVKRRDAALTTDRKAYEMTFKNQAAVINDLQVELQKKSDEIKQLKNEAVFQEARVTALKQEQQDNIQLAEIARLKTTIKSLSADLERLNDINGCITKEGKVAPDVLRMHFNGVYSNAWNTIYNEVAEFSRKPGQQMNWNAISNQTAKLMYYTPKTVLKALEKYATEEKQEAHAVDSRIASNWYLPVQAWMRLFIDDDQWTEEKILEYMKHMPMPVLDLLKSEIESGYIKTVICKAMRMVYDGEGVFIGEDVKEDE